MHSTAPHHGSKPRQFSLLLYGSSLWALWIGALALCVGLELLPAPGIPPTLFYARLALKVIGFLVVGLATPLSLWQFHFLGFGLVAALFSTGLGEIGQHLIVGHRTSPLECLIKIILIGCGLLLGLNYRYERKARFGYFMITFIDPHCQSS